MRQKMTGTQGTPTDSFWLLGETILYGSRVPGHAKNARLCHFLPKPPFLRVLLAESNHDGETMSPFQDKKQAYLWFAIKLADCLNPVFNS